ncbi:hypothetical protein [Acaryochloris sp. IP29b_bin.137]|uniref:hypothetical protein n=1 Tax=Acaryochloris sp. IP29b_bin.137 TaxID=2969217 RepID=UPI0026335533|nr:hypothetical protein [Acaryochloris sp. IP29b_bin.137]
MSNGPISQFSKDFVRLHVIKDELDTAYKLMAEDRKRELKALSWSEAVIGDFDV